MPAVGTFEWLVRPTEDQGVVKRCPGCDAKRIFRSSGAFRVNAQKKTLDVWHIYKCEKCDYTWNIDVIERSNRRNIEPNLYNRFLQNDPDEARRLTFDYRLLALNRAELAGSPDFEVTGPDLDALSTHDFARGEVRFEFLLPIRLAVVLTKKLSLSRRRLNGLIESGHLRGVTSADLQSKAKHVQALGFDIAPVLEEVRAQAEARTVEQQAMARRRASS
jgi:hypothetical protein